MLTHIQIRNLAVVRQLDVDFSAGMTAITGETGAGKSIALDALGLCLGDRADAEMVRAGCPRAEVTAQFELQNTDAAQQWLLEHELADDNEPVCLLRRVIHAEGRSRAWINGAPVTATQLRELGPLLVNIHGQHEHQLLSRSDYQQQLLDAFAGHENLLAAVRSRYQTWYDLRLQQKKLLQQKSEFEARKELLSYQVQELDDFALAEGEYEEIDQQFKRLANSAGLIEDSEFALNVIYEVEHNSAYGLLQSAMQRLEQQLEHDAALSEPLNLLREASVQIDEAARELRHYHEQLESDPALLQELEQRVTQALKLAKKHQVEPQSLTDKHAQLRAELDQLTHADEALAGLQDAIQTASNSYREAALQLHTSRQTAATDLSDKIVSAMQQLNMPHGQFLIAVEHQANGPATASGTDQIQFQVSANPGQPLQAMSKVASGGELSRISLAVQVITASKLTTPTLMFDEVDVGVSGPTAATVGKLLRQLGSTTQVICVTHLPQVAARAQQQLQVEKYTDGQTTETRMICLTEKQRILELARLLGGDQVTEATKANALELLRAS